MIMKRFWFAAIGLGLAGCTSGEEDAPPQRVTQRPSPQPSPTSAPVTVAPAPPAQVPSPLPTATAIPGSQIQPQQSQPPAQQSVPQVAEATPVPLGNSTIENDSGRWLQVDVYDASGRAFDTLNLRFGDNDVMPTETRKVEIRVNGKSVPIDRGNMKIKINREEDLEIAN